MSLTATLKHTAQRIPVPEPKLPSNKNARINDTDLEDTDERGHIIEDNVHTAAFITYKDSKGNISERRISIKNLKRTSNGHITILAYCYERKRTRNFRADRVIEAVDLATGEVLSDPAQILELLGLPAQTQLNDPQKGTLKALKKSSDALNILIYLGRCDGEFHVTEENVIIHYLMSEHFDTEFDDAFLLQRLQNHFTDMNSFFESLDELEENNPEALNKIYKYAAELIQADGKILKVETSLMVEIENYLETPLNLKGLNEVIERLEGFFI